MKRLLLYGFLLSFCSFVNVYSQSAQNEYLGSVAKVHATIDWRHFSVSIVLEGTLDRSEKNRLSQVSRQESDLRMLGTEYLTSALDSLLVDSRTTLQERFKKDSTIEESLKRDINGFKVVDAKPAASLQGTSVIWKLPFFPQLASLVGPIESKGEKPSSPLGWKPDQVMSSIVIYADELLPWWGMNNNAWVAACLYPEVFDDEMNILHGTGTIDSQTEMENGVVHYIADSDIKNMRNVLGNSAFFIRARSVFGKNPSSPVISREDADIIRSSTSGRQLLTEGKIFIVLSPAELRKDYDLLP